MPEISNTDLRKAVSYLETAARLYEAISAAGSQAANCRAHMIRQLVAKINAKIQPIKK